MVCPQLPRSRIAPETANFSRAAQSSPRRNPARLCRSQTGFPAAGLSGFPAAAAAAAGNSEQPRRIAAIHAFSAGRNAPELRSVTPEVAGLFVPDSVPGRKLPVPAAAGRGLGRPGEQPWRGPSCPGARSFCGSVWAPARGRSCARRLLLLRTATFRRIEKPRSQPWGAPPGCPEGDSEAGFSHERQGPR